MPVDPRLGRVLLAFWFLISFGLLTPLFLGLGSATEIGALAEPSLRRILRLGQNTLSLALLAAVLASIWAVPIALAAMKCSSAHARMLMLGVASLPLFVPPSALVVAAIRLFGAGGFLTEIIWGAGTVFPLGEGLGSSPMNLPGAPIYTLPGGSFVLAWSLFPLVILVLAVALNRGDGDAERAALLEAGPFKVMARISLPLASGGLAVGACLVFLFSLTNFSIPESLRGLPVLVTEVYVQFGVYYDTRRALEAALVLLVLSLIGIGVAGGLLRRVTSGDDAQGDAANFEGFLFPPSWQSLMIRVMGWTAAVLPMLALVFVLARTATGPQGVLEVWRTTWITAREEFLFTTGLGLLSAACASILGLGLGAALAAIRPSWLLRLLIAAPLVIPGPIYGIAMQILLRRPPESLPIGLDNMLADLSRTTVPLMLAWCIQFAPIIALISERLLRAVPHEEREAALLDGASLLARWKALYWPAVWPGVAAGALVVFALTLGEEGAAVLLLPPGPTTLGVRLLTLMHYAPTGQVSALCLLMMVPGILAFALAAGLMLLRSR